MPYWNIGKTAVDLICIKFSLLDFGIRGQALQYLSANPIVNMSIFILVLFSIPFKQSNQYSAWMEIKNKKIIHLRCSWIETGPIGP